MAAESGPARRPDWDARYHAAGAPLFGDAPCQYLQMIAARSDFQPQSALLLADGDGRNGTFLARRAIAVTAVDISSVATALAEARDAQASVAAHRITADLATWCVPAGQSFDAVLAFYLQCEPAVRARAFAAAIEALAPGGWFVVEAFARHAGTPRGLGPEHPGPRYDLAELEAAAAAGGLTVVEAFTGRTLLAEGSAHRGEAHVVRFAAFRAA